MMRFAPALFRLILCLGTAAAAWPAPAQDAIGRLFYTPVQRATLDTARRQRARAALAEDAEQSAPAPQTITYSGVVRRSDGRNTVFLNNRAVPERELNSGAAVVGSVLNDGAIILQAPQSGRVATLKPGQRIELLSGAIEEAYSRSPTAKAGSKSSGKRVEKSADGPTPGAQGKQAVARPAPEGSAERPATPVP